ncbi:hypothetical protein Tco_0241976 [Tanacetum coccineum]
MAVNNLLGFTDLMRQKKQRMKQEGLIQHYGILEDLKSNSSYLLQVLMLTMLNLCGKSLYKLSKLFLLIRPIWAVPLRRAGKKSLTLSLTVNSRSLLSITMGRIHNIHHRSASPFHLAEKDLRLGNRKFVSKGEVDEVFGMPIPNELILNNIRNAPLLQCILGMDRKALI